MLHCYKLEIQIETVQRKFVVRHWMEIHDKKYRAILFFLFTLYGLLLLFCHTFLCKDSPTSIDGKHSSASKIFFINKNTAVLSTTKSR